MKQRKEFCGGGVQCSVTTPESFDREEQRASELMSD
jgi:hypothetical protein